ncbi:MAG: PAS domain-containing protein [Alphaproteobacteria bacterium]|nr:PAS domain-containing protein [Alphaproteobacteria bacterium]
MVSDRLSIGLALRSFFLLVSLALLAYALVTTHWYVVEVLLLLLVMAQLTEIIHALTRTNREIARFLDAIAYDDTSQSFTGLSRQAPYRDLGAAMGRVMDRLREGRSEREEMGRYLAAMLAHVPVALIAREEDGRYVLLNTAARQMFGLPATTKLDPDRYGIEFRTGLDQLKAGARRLLHLELSGSMIAVKAAATSFWARGEHRTLISLQNIGDELSAQQLDAWHSLIRTIAHEVMNSLTPISSLSQTARELVATVQADLPEGGEPHRTLGDALEALDAVARRSEGLLHFVQNHRRLTQRMTARPEDTLLVRVFARMERLLGPEMAARGIEFARSCSPETLKLRVDPELLDQALINLLRNAMEAVAGHLEAKIQLSGEALPGGEVAIRVSDNGPGIAAELREQIFIPFFTTKQQGTGVGLTLVRQIASLHGGSVTLGEYPGRGATFTLRLPA